MSTSRGAAGSGEPELPDGTRGQPILVDEDQDTPQSGIGFQVEQLVRQVRRGDARFDPIDLDGEDDSLSEDPWRADEDNYDNENAKIEREEPAIEPEDTQDGPCVHWKKAVRNPCPCGTHQRVPKVTVGGMELGESRVVELKEPVRVGRYGAEFVEIHEIWMPHKGDHILVRGRTYCRTRNLEGRIEPRKNEVCEIYELDESDHRATDPVRYLEQALVEVPIQDIKTTRTLHKTNKAFPECRFDRVRYRSREEREDEAPLTCRWQMVLSYPDPRYRRQQRPIAGEVIRHYNQDDIPKDRHRLPDGERRKAHEKIRGGSFIPNGARQAGREASPIHLAPGQKYTVVDIFSGAGGYSKGAEMAGLKILAACDHWPRCCETYRRNFPGTELHQEDVYRFIEDMSTDLTREPLNVDILHFSPPCQTWSPAHTCEGKKDEENRATLFACEKIITIFKPRIFTVEQTFGLAQDRWIPNFNALLQGFTRHGYSVRWKVLHLVEYGLPQTRKRLVMIGAAPGEQIPDWPKPTHSKDPKDGQKPFVSASNACSALVEGQDLHDVESARPTNRAPWDSSKPLGRTITTSGGQSYHHSGLRDLTLRELAMFQGFPSTFVFMGKCIKKQIGNAFAPIVVKTLLKCIRAHLEDFDGVTRQPPPGQIIVVTDDDDDDDHDDNDHQNKRLQLQLQHNDHVQAPAESQFVPEDLGGFCRRPSGPSFLHGMIEDCQKNSVQCFLAKQQLEQKSFKGGGSSGPSLPRPSQVSSRQAQPPQRNTMDSYHILDNNQDSPTATSIAAPGNINAPPKTAANPDPGLTTPEQENNTAYQDVPLGTSSTPLRIPPASDKTAGQQTSNTIHQRISRNINAGTISAPPRQKSSELDEPHTGQGTESAASVAHLGPAAHHTRSGTIHLTAARSSDQTIFGCMLEAPTRRPFNPDTNITMLRQISAPIDPSHGETDVPMARQSVNSSDSQNDEPAAHQTWAPTAQTVADLGCLSPQTRSACLCSPEHHSAENVQTLAGLEERPEAAEDRMAFRGLAEGTEGRQVDETIAGALDAARHDTADAEPTPQSGFIEDSVSSWARQTGTPAAVRDTSHGIQTGDGAPGPSQPRPSGGSGEHMGESSRAGARRSPGIFVEDDEEGEGAGSEGQGSYGDKGSTRDGDAGEVDDDNDPQLQDALWTSRAGAPSLADAAIESRRPDERRERCLEFQRMMLARLQTSEDNGAEMNGPGDCKDKGPSKRSLDEDEEAENPKKRRRGGE